MQDPLALLVSCRLTWLTQQVNETFTPLEIGESIQRR